MLLCFIAEWQEKFYENSLCIYLVNIVLIVCLPAKAFHSVPAFLRNCVTQLYIPLICSTSVRRKERCHKHKSWSPKKSSKKISSLQIHTNNLLRKHIQTVY